MSRLLTAILLAMAVVLSGLPARADGYYYKSKPYAYGGYYGDYHYGYKSHRYKHYRHHKHYRHYGYDRRYYHHQRHGDIGDEVLIGAGIIGGAIIVGSVLSQPRPAPPPVYYQPAPAPYCVQDQVYRYLPDGRTQWGTRTRCY